MIDAQELSKSFGDMSVLQNITVHIAVQQRVAVLGASGSGKSTLLRCINGLDTLTGGTLTVMGAPLPSDAKGLQQFRAHVGMVFQQWHLFPHLTVLENCTLAPLHIQRILPIHARERAMRWLEKFDMHSHAQKYVYQLSGGQQQRVAMARALCMQPKILLADEPTSALDPSTAQNMAAVLRDCAAEGMTIIAVTHDMAFARQFATRVLFIDEGRVHEDAPPEQFFIQPSTAKAQQFLGR